MTIIIHVAHCTSHSILPKQTILSSIPKKRSILFLPFSPFPSPIFSIHVLISLYRFIIYIYIHVARDERSGAFSLFPSFYYSHSVAIFRPCYSKSCAELKGSSRSSYAVLAFLCPRNNSPSFSLPRWNLSNGILRVLCSPLLPLLLTVRVKLRVQLENLFHVSLSRVKRLEVDQV